MWAECLEHSRESLDMAQNTANPLEPFQTSKDRLAARQKFPHAGRVFALVSEAPEAEFRPSVAARQADDAA
jgi:hypothetical protein